MTAMGELANSVGAILSRVERRSEVAAQNISNATTPGYRRVLSFDSLIGTNTTRSLDEISPDRSIGTQTTIDLTQGQLQTTGNQFDLALSGDGFFVVRSPEGEVLFTRAGQFQRDGEGHLVTGRGFVLQRAGGGDLTVDVGDVQILGDGTVIQGEDSAGRVGVVTVGDPTVLSYTDNGLYTAPDSAVRPKHDVSITQGALEASNVSLGVEMISLMEAMRQAQAGQRVMQTYNDMLGHSITTFGQV